MILIIPSVLIFLSVIEDTQKDAAINKFAKSCLGDKQKYLDSYQLYQYEDGHEVLYLKCYGNQISPADLSSYEDCLTSFNPKLMESVRIEILASSEVNLNDFTGLQENIQNLDDQLKAVKEIRAEQNQLMLKTNTNPLDSQILTELNDELRILYPKLEEISIGKITTLSDDQMKMDVPILQVRWTNRTNDSKAEQLKAFIQERLDLDTLMMYK